MTFTKEQGLPSKMSLFPRYGSGTPGTPKTVFFCLLKRKSEGGHPPALTHLTNPRPNTLILRPIIFGRPPSEPFLLQPVICTGIQNLRSTSMRPTPVLRSARTDFLISLHSGVRSVAPWIFTHCLGDIGLPQSIVIPTELCSSNLGDSTPRTARYWTPATGGHPVRIFPQWPLMGVFMFR